MEDFLIEVPLGDATDTFDLERDAFSHGLFMMAPNQWDPECRTFSRPLRLLPDSHSVLVSITQPSPSANLLLRVHGVASLSIQHQTSLVQQVIRMLRLSDDDETIAKDFIKLAESVTAGKAQWISGFGGRVFRSPTLFEDMVKCILLCNCQWARTLQMAKSLCKLRNAVESIKDFAPKTPSKREGRSNRKRKTDDEQMGNTQALKCIEETLPIENFPSPEEVANTDEKLLTSFCKLGYRGERISLLAKSIVSKKFDLELFEELCAGNKLSNYENVSNMLGGIKGFGAFTSANVLMCMGYYHVIPSDSETLRHLKQVHGKKCSSKGLLKCVENVYGDFGSLQFLVYWAEMWYFYEKKFGKLSQLACNKYHVLSGERMKLNNS